MFQGFSPAVVDFMWDLRFYNEKVWFEAHRESFESLLRQPMMALAEQVSLDFAQAMPDLGLEHKVSRIYRDARRLHGQGPYKDHLWFTIYQPSEEWELPVFWFELTPTGCSWGLGYYLARPDTMARHRARVERRPAELTALQNLLNGQSRFVLEGQSYARPKGDPGPLLFDWYNKKTFSLIHEQSHEGEVFSAALAQRLVEDFCFLAPFYRYFSTLPLDPPPCF